MAGVSTLYEQVDQAKAKALADPDDETLVPMWMLLLHVAEPVGLRTCGDLEEARHMLRWAHWLWNLVRMREEPRKEQLEDWADALDEFTASPKIMLEMTIRAQAWPDRRVVAAAKIDVLPTGAWQVAVASAVPPTPCGRKSFGP